MDVIPRSDHLLLLIGSNPLPNALAAILLATKKSTITLVHSDDSFNVGQRLQAWLISKGFQTPRMKRVAESEPSSIFRGITDELKEIKSTNIGLHYTGGTKAMSVHSYRTIENWVSRQRQDGRNTNAVFSYLNPRKQEMVFDPHDPSSGQRETVKYVGLSLELTLRDLLQLHGWTLKHDPNVTPILSSVAQVLAGVCADSESFKEWRMWILDELRAKCRRTDRDEWKGDAQLPVSIMLPSHNVLQKAVQVFNSYFELEANELQLKQPAFKSKAKHFCEWLDGKWLEHHVLNELKVIENELRLHEVQQNIETHEVQFDVDVVALRGYQLFAISCSTDSGKGLLKSKLFEAFIRARQLGGDEARVALVCCADKPENIEQEMRRHVDPEGKIRVFGQPHLVNLREHLKQWIQEQSKGG